MARKNSINFEVSIGANEIFDALVLLGFRDQNRLLKVIKELDLQMADWNFTLDLYEHFKALKEEHTKECESDFLDHKVRQ